MNYFVVFSYKIGKSCKGVHFIDLASFGEFIRGFVGGVGPVDRRPLPKWS